MSYTALHRERKKYSELHREKSEIFRRSWTDYHYKSKGDYEKDIRKINIKLRESYDRQKITEELGNIKNIKISEGDVFHFSDDSRKVLNDNLMIRGGEFSMEITNMTEKYYDIRITISNGTRVKIKDRYKSSEYLTLSYDNELMNRSAVLRFKKLTVLKFLIKHYKGLKKHLEANERTFVIDKVLKN